MGISGGEYTAKPNLPGDESVFLFLGFTINLRILRFFSNYAPFLYARCVYINRTSYEQQ